MHDAYLCIVTSIVHKLGFVQLEQVGELGVRCPA